MNKDLVNEFATCQMREGVATTATATSDIVDTQGYESLTVLVNYATLANADAGDYFTAKLQHSNTTVTGDFEDVAVGFLNGAFTDTTAVTANIQKVGYESNKRYVRCVITETSDTGNISSVISVIGILGHARVKPSTVVAITATT
jgi:hypothetical protein